jgi:hypothetical protein
MGVTRHSFRRTAAVAIAALTVACVTSRPEQREVAPVLVAEPPQVDSIPLAGSSLVPLEAASIAERSPATPPAAPDPVERILIAARGDLGKRGRGGGIDCSTYVRSAYLAAGIDLYASASPRDNGVRAIHRYVRKHGRLQRARLPAKGDLVFFDNSYDRNRDGRLNDPFTHAGLVEQVLADGTAMIIHATNHGIVREPMNLLRPHEDADADRRPINAPLRRKTARDPAHMPRLMSELFAGFGTVLPRMATSASRL